MSLIDDFADRWRFKESVCLALRELTSTICKKTGQEPRTGLGGPDGYGAKYESDEFVMYPFCWCESPGCPYCDFLPHCTRYWRQQGIPLPKKAY